MANRIDPFNSPTEDINGTANDDMVIMDDLAVDNPRTMAFGVSPNIESSDDSRFHSVSYDELDREADEDFLALESLVCEPDNSIGTTVTHTSAKIPPSCNIQTTDTWNAFSMAQSLMEKCAFLLVDKAVYCYIDRAYVLLDDVALDRLIFQFHKDAISMQGKTGIITEIRKFIKLGDVLDGVETDQEHIVFLNGRYNLADNCFEPNGSDIFATSYLNFEYDPNARECEHFKSFLKFVSGGNDSLKQLILEVMGYLLSCNNTAKKFFVLFGPGNTGKSLFLSLMREFFPMQFVSTIELQELGGRFSSGNLVDTRLNIGGDLPNKVLSADVIKTVKGLTGNDIMTAERKFQQPFSYKPTTKLLFATNHKITIAYKDEQFIERLVVLPFLNSVPPEDQDRKLLDKMKDERPAIFNKVLKAFKRLRDNNFIFTEVDENKKFVNFPTTGNENRSFLTEAIEQFIDQCCLITDYKDDFTTISNLYSAFSDFYMERYNLNIEMDEFSKAFKAAASEIGLEYKQRNCGRGYRGIILNRDND